jgi:hypothetical protein
MARLDAEEKRELLAAVQMDAGYLWIRRPEALEQLARFAIS